MPVTLKPISIGVITLQCRLVLRTHFYGNAPLVPREFLCQFFKNQAKSELHDNNAMVRIYARKRIFLYRNTACEHYDIYCDLADEDEANCVRVGVYSCLLVQGV